MFERNHDGLTWRPRAAHALLAEGDGGEPGGGEPGGGGTPGGGEPGGGGGTPGGGEPGGGVDWMGALSADVQTALKPKGYQNPEELAKAYLSLESKIGANRIALPGENATPEEREEFFNSLGRPEKVDGYDLGDFKPPESIAGFWNQDLQSSMLGRMHTAGLTNKQVQDVVSGFAEEQAKLFDGMTAGLEKQLSDNQASLKTEWGDAFDAKMDLANRLFAQAFGDDLDAARQMLLADGSYLFDNPKVVKAFATMAETISEDGALPQGGSSSFTKTPSEAAAEIDRLKSDTEFQNKFLNSRHPEHADAVKLMQSLQAMAAAGKRG